jgi:hypothetical protein
LEKFNALVATSKSELSTSFRPASTDLGSISLIGADVAQLLTMKLSEVLLSTRASASTSW